MTKTEAVEALARMARKHERLVRACNKMLDVQIGHAPEDWGDAQNEVIRLVKWGEDAKKKGTR